MEFVKCDFCGADDARVVTCGSDVMFPQNKEIYAIQQCNQCGLFYLNPRPTTPEEVLAMYPPEYDSYVDVGKQWLLNLRQAVWHSELLDIARSAGTDGSILEVGCATGEYLHGLRQLGCPNVVGVEYNPHAATLAQTRYGLTVIVGDIFSGQFPPGSFDVVVMRYVMEHIPNPMSTLREVSRILRPGGWYFFSIPNPDSLDAQVYGKYWFGHEIPRHLHNYPHATLERMLQVAGFEQKHIDYAFIPNDWILGFRNVLIGCDMPRWAIRQFDIDRPIALALCFPLGILSGILRRSGRMRVTAQKRQKI